MTGADGPLSGVRVLDLTQFLAGPFGTQILGDLGADVIKVEPRDGELSRRIPPVFVGDDSAYYLSANRNKRSVVLDLRASQGLDVLRALIAESDIVIDSFRPGALARLGIDPHQEVERAPGLVWCSISGFGQDSAYGDRPAYDMIVQAMAGTMSLTGEIGGAPVRAGVPIGDLAAGLYGVIGVLAALNESRRTGHGQVIDIAMYDCQVALLSYQGANHLIGNLAPGAQGRGHDYIPTYRTFTAARGDDVVVTANTERMWRSLCLTLDLGELIDDPLFATGESRYANRTELWGLLDAAFLSQDAGTIVQALNDRGVPAAMVRNIGEVFADQHTRDRGMVLELARDDGTSIDVPGSPIKLAARGRSTQEFPPRLGQDTLGVLRSVGLSDAYIQHLTETGVVSVGPDEI